MYKVRIFTTTGRVREFTVTHYDYALERVEHYRNNYRLFDDAVVLYFNGVCWEEVAVDNSTPVTKKDLEEELRELGRFFLVSSKVLQTAIDNGDEEAIEKARRIYCDATKLYNRAKDRFDNMRG